MVIYAEAVYAGLGVLGLFLSIGWFFACLILTGLVWEDILKHGWWILMCWILDAFFVFGAVYCIAVAGKMG